MKRVHHDNVKKVKLPPQIPVKIPVRLPVLQPLRPKVSNSNQIIPVEKPICAPHVQNPNPNRQRQRLRKKTSSSIENRPPVSEADSRAPSHEIFTHCSNHLISYENQIMLRLQVQILRDQVREDTKHLHRHRGLALTTSVVYIISAICRSLKLTDGIKFAALEIYDRFMIKYNREVVEQLLKTDKATVEETDKRLKQQAFLRILSCIQLASKVYTDSNVLYISSTEVQKILREFKIEFKLEAINASEVRVMKLLNYELKYVNSLEVMECILTGLSLDVDYSRQIYDLAIEGLEFVSLRHEEVYTMFLKNWKENCGEKERKAFRRIEYNKSIEAAGILAGVICLLRPKDQKKLLPAIAEISGTNMEDFMILGTILAGVMVGHLPYPVPKRSKPSSAV